MIDATVVWLSWMLGLESEDLAVWQMVIRAVVVYPIGIAFVRLGEKRFIGKFTAFDVIMGIMIGSMLARAITGGSPFLATLAAGLALVVLHHVFATLSFHSERFGNLVKGSGRTLVQDGSIQWSEMRKSHISEGDLLAAIRETGGVEHIQQVRLARLERSGNISVLTRSD